MSRFSPPRETERWDRSRFEAYGRGGDVVAEKDVYDERDYYTRPAAQHERSPEYRREAPRVREEDRYYYKEEDRYEAPRRSPRHYWEETRDTHEGAMVPVPRDRREVEIDIHERERQLAPRPKFVRRQSSLDTFDRRPMPRYGDRVREETIYLPTRPRRTSPPRYSSPPRFTDRDYDDIHIAEPEFYGDDRYRGYREREIERWRTNKKKDDSSDEEVEEEKAETVISERTERSGKTSRTSKTVKTEKSVAEKEYPRKGKTRMPMRIVSERAVIELGYPFEKEGETLIILKALGKEHIDEVIRISKEMKAPPPKSPSIHPSEHPSRAASRPPYDPPQGEREVRTTTYVFEHNDAKPPPPDIDLIPPPPPGFEDKVVERRTEIIKEGDGPSSEVPRSVREWDVMTKQSSHHSTHRSPSPASSHHTHHTHRTHHTRKTSKSHKSRRRSRAASASHVRSRSISHAPSSSSSDSTTRELIVTERDESASIHGPIQTLIVPSRKDRSTRDIEEEIRLLRAERKALRYEREDRSEGGEIIIARRSRSRSRSNADKLEIRKDKKGRLTLRR